jgi:small-conductance mechanosensitive channel
MVVLLLLPLASPVQAQSPSPTASAQPISEQLVTGLTPTMVALGGQPLFEIRARAGALSAVDRAQLVSQRLTQIADNSEIPISSVRSQMDEQNLLIVAGKDPPITILAITARDAELAQQSPDKLATHYIQKIQTAIETYRAERTPGRILQGVFYTILATVALVLTFRALDWLYATTVDRLKRWIEHHDSILGFQGTRSISFTPFLELVLRLVDLTRNILNLVILGFYAFWVLSFFPWTQPLAKNFWSLVSHGFNQIINAILAYLPNLIILVLIIFITREILAFIRLFFREVERGNISISWLYPDWIAITLKLVSFFVMALAVAIAMPFMPGFNSPAFQGVSLLISALLTFGAANTVSNIVGGIVAVYTRSFQLGDMIKIGDLMGIVVVKELLVTRIRTPKNVVITIPNSTIITSNVINYSALAKQSGDDTGLILHTTITLGYDIPWQKVHATLIAAAYATPDILHHPAPFVLQTALNDFNISYELNAFTDHPEKCQFIYSDLHQNIQDKCNEVGIEILSPNYHALRDGNHSTIPENYLPEDYQSPGFRIEP